MREHELYMQRCMELAQRGAGSVSPNPLVGAVVVYHNKIIGEGWHQHYGGPHAEVLAIRSVDDKTLLKESTLYVNLEPCSHFGKTPPCADLIIQSRIPRVVVGMTDPFEKVAGTGIQKLRDAGIEVITDIKLQENLELNKRFITYVTQKRPYIILKWAQTRDGYIAPIRERMGAEEFEQKRHITGFIVQKLVHQWRSMEDAIMVGTHTIQTDNPALNVRAWEGRNPLRITLDASLKLKLGGYKIYDGSQPTLIFTNQAFDSDIPNLSYAPISFQENIWPQIAEVLYARSVQSLIIEGGYATLLSVLESGLWDEIQTFTTPNYMQYGVPAPVVSQIPEAEYQIDGSVLQVFRNR